MNYCASSGSERYLSERNGVVVVVAVENERIGIWVPTFLSERKRREEDDGEQRRGWLILSNGTTIAKGRNVSREESAQKIPIDILSTLRSGTKRRTKRRSRREPGTTNEDKENDDDTKATATAFWRRNAATTPPTSPIKKPISTTSNANTPRKRANPNPITTVRKRRSETPTT